MHKNIGQLAAISCVRGEGNIRGVVRFYECGAGTVVAAEIFSLTDGFHGFHIHTGSSCMDRQGHFDPGNVGHPDHAGDMPSLLSCSGRARLTVWTDRFRVCQVVGRAVVIHSGRDDFTTQPAGDSGRMIACGVIERC